MYLSFQIGSRKFIVYLLIIFALRWEKNTALRNDFLLNSAAEGWTLLSKNPVLCFERCSTAGVPLPLDVKPTFKQQPACLVQSQIVNSVFFCKAPNDSNSVTSDYQNYLYPRGEYVSSFGARKYCRYFKFKVLSLETKEKQQAFINYVKNNGGGIFEDTWVTATNAALLSDFFLWAENSADSNSAVATCLFITRLLGAGVEVSRGDCYEPRRVMCELPRTCGAPLCNSTLLKQYQQQVKPPLTSGPNFTKIENSTMLAPSVNFSLLVASIKTNNLSTSSNNTALSKSSLVSLNVGAAMLKSAIATGAGASMNKKTRSCGDPICPKYQCEVDKRFILPNRTINVPKEMGTFRKICGRNYFVSNVMGVLTKAFSVCCAINMTLLIVDTNDEGECLQKSFKATKDDYLTALSDEGCEGKFWWCGNPGRYKAKEVLWGTNQPDNSMGAENCVTIQFKPNSYSLQDRKCFTPYKFICEEDDKQPVTPQQMNTSQSNDTKCSKSCISCNSSNNTSVVPTNGTWQALNKTGEVRTLCKVNYYFSSRQMNITDAALHCCSLGLSLLRLDSKAEVTCVQKEIKREFIGALGIFWIGASDATCSGQWNWCDRPTSEGSQGSQGSQGLPSWLRWGENLPGSDRSQNCVGLYYRGGVNWIGNDYCFRTYRFICKKT